MNDPGPRVPARQARWRWLVAVGLPGDPVTATGVGVLFTHDCGLAARVAWPLWCAEREGGLTPPVRHWWRREPPDPATVERDGYEQWWWPARPGAPGAIPLVESLSTLARTAGTPSGPGSRISVRCARVAPTATRSPGLTVQ